MCSCAPPRLSRLCYIQATRGILVCETGVSHGRVSGEWGTILPVSLTDASVALGVGGVDGKQLIAVVFLLVRERSGTSKQPGASSSETDSSQVRAGEKSKSGAILAVSLVGAAVAPVALVFGLVNTTDRERHRNNNSTTQGDQQDGARLITFSHLRHARFRQGQPLLLGFSRALADGKEYEGNKLLAINTTDH